MGKLFLFDCTGCFWRPSAALTLTNGGGAVTRILLALLLKIDARERKHPKQSLAGTLCTREEQRSGPPGVIFRLRGG